MLSEDVMLGAVMFGHREMQKVINAINELVAEAGTKACDVDGAGQERRADRRAAAKPSATSSAQAFQVRDKLQRRDAISAIKKDVLAALAGRAEAEGWNAGELSQGIRRARIPDHARLGARAPRSASTAARSTPCARSASKVGVLPRTHGSSLFTRGETQAIVVATLGTARDGQIIDAVAGEYKEHFLFHYNFPPLLGR